MTKTRIMMTILSSWLGLFASDCVGTQEIDPTVFVQRTDSLEQALGTTYLDVKISPDNVLGSYLSGTRLTISWDVVGSAPTGAFTLEQGGRVLANSISPNSYTWTVPTVADVKSYWFELKLWDGEPGKSSYNVFTTGLLAQPKPWTSRKLPVLCSVFRRTCFRELALSSQVGFSAGALGYDPQ